MADSVKAAFDFRSILVPLAHILPIRQIKPGDSHFGKYRSILASIREVGVIEPLVVHPQKHLKGQYLLLDGHLRLKALKELGKTETLCLVAATDDAFTYNDKVNRLPPIQEHKMIVRAIKEGVTAEKIARALDIDISKIRQGLNLLEGIHPDAVELLKDKPITAAAVRLFKRVKAVRQLDFAQLMVSMGNYTNAYARALLLATPPDMLVNPETSKTMRGLKSEDLAQMEKEMETLERDFRVYQDSYGQNALSLNVVQRYVKRLLDNAAIKKFLVRRYAEILEELTDITELEAL